MRIAIVAVLLLLLSAASAHAQECAVSSDPALDDLGQTLQGWQKYDEDAVRDVNGDVAHWASTKANVSAVARDWHLMLHPNGGEMMAAVAQLPILGPLLAVAVAPAAVVGDVLEVVGGPFMIVKDGADVVTHGVLSVFSRDGALPPKRRPSY